MLWDILFSFFCSTRKGIITACTFSRYAKRTIFYKKKRRTHEYLIAPISSLLSLLSSFFPLTNQSFICPPTLQLYLLQLYSTVGSQSLRHVSLFYSHNNPVKLIRLSEWLAQGHPTSSRGRVGIDPGYDYLIAHQVM